MRILFLNFLTKNSMIDEGYIKFKCRWDKTIVHIDKSYIDDINYYRSRLIDMGMIGKIIDGPGYGNISCRLDSSNFLITGSDTGGVNTLNQNHLSIVKDVNVDTNTLSCSGMTIASSESMSHAIIYKTLKSVQSVVHIHDSEMWHHYKHKLPTTDSTIFYGTPEMAYAIESEVKDNIDSNSLVLGGHEDGIIVFGSSFKECFLRVGKLFEKII